MWKTDGTTAGTVLVREDSFPYFGTVRSVAGKIYYVEESGTVWASDGTSAGTVPLVARNFDDDNRYGPQFTEFDGRVYFTPLGAQLGLWSTDGTPEGTSMAAGIKGSHELENFAGKMYFSADDAIHGLELWSLSGVPTVSGRHVFYNNSAFDGNDPIAGAADDDAIALDKFALLPGDNAIFTNYTTYDRGINGVMVDIDKLSGTPTAADFEFRIGNDDSPEDWALASTPLEVSVRRGAGFAKSDRVTFTWPDGSIVNQWLQVTVKATAATGLATPDVFYFGSTVGDTLNHPFNTIVNAVDEIGIRNHATDSAAINDQYDINRDGAVNAADEMIARANSTAFGTALPLIRPPMSSAESPTAPAAVAEVANLAPVTDESPSQTLVLPMSEAASGAADAVSVVVENQLSAIPSSIARPWLSDLEGDQQLATDFNKEEESSDNDLAPLDDELLDLLVGNCLSDELEVTQ
jgi:hypothetical protein